MKLINKLQSSEPGGIRIKTLNHPINPIIIQPSLLRRGRKGPLGPLILNEAVPHLLLHTLHSGSGVLLVDVIIVTKLHWFVAIDVSGGGGEGILGGENGFGEEGGEVGVSLVEGGVDLEEMGRVRGVRELFGCEDSLLHGQYKLWYWRLWWWFGHGFPK